MPEEINITKEEAYLAIDALSHCIAAKRAEIGRGKIDARSANAEEVIMAQMSLLKDKLRMELEG